MMDGWPPDGSKRGWRLGETVVTPSGAAIRPEMIAYAKTLLAGGLVGRNPHRLADRLIDIALTEGEWLWPADR
jgi:hypothetical protein